MTDFFFLGSKITAVGDCSYEIRKQLLLGRKAMKKPRQCVEKERHYSVNNGLYCQGYGFPRGYVWL